MTKPTPGNSMDSGVNASRAGSRRGDGDLPSLAGGHAAFLCVVLYFAVAIATGNRTALLLMLVRSLIGLAIALGWWAWYHRKYAERFRLLDPDSPAFRAGRSRGLTRVVIGIAILGFGASALVWFWRLLALSQFIQSQGVNGLRGS